MKLNSTVHFLQRAILNKWVSNYSYSSLLTKWFWLPQVCTPGCMVVRVWETYRSGEYARIQPWFSSCVWLDRKQAGDSGITVWISTLLTHMPLEEFFLSLTSGSHLSNKWVLTKSQLKFLTILRFYISFCSHLCEFLFLCIGTYTFLC